MFCFSYKIFLPSHGSILEFCLAEKISNCFTFTVLLNIVLSGKWCGNPSEIKTKMSVYV